MELLTGKIVIVQATRKRYVVRIQSVNYEPMIVCMTDSGSQFTVPLKNYAEASPGERKAFQKRLSNKAALPERCNIN